MAGSWSGGGAGGGSWICGIDLLLRDVWKGRSAIAESVILITFMAVKQADHRFNL